MSDSVTSKNIMGLIVKLYAILATILVLNIVTLRAEDSCVIEEFIQVEEIVSKCKNIVVSNLSVPGGQQLNLNLTDGSTLSFRGTTTFDFYEWKGPLVAISGRNIHVFGEKGSVLDGQGPLWWDGQGTWGNTTKPKFTRISATNAVFDGLNIRNCPVGCINITASENVTIRNWKIDNLEGDEGVAPENKFGHNTDGFGVGTSRNILIEDTIVYNQDDCVALNSGQNMTVRNLFCHGSHGLTVSAGAATIEDVLIENSIITMAENGIHVKTHVNSKEGLIKNVLYRNITLLDCKYYGINIQQNYRNLPAGEPQDGPPKNNIPIHNLTMENIYGNVLNGAVPVYVLCAEEGCFDWKWKGITIYGELSDNCTNYIPQDYSC